MKMAHLSVVAATLAVTLSTSAFAVESQIGDQDGFGIGVMDGEGFDWSDVGAGDGDGTDVWQHNTQSYVFSYSLPAGALTASLEVFTGGQGLGGLTSVFINSQLVGTLTDGDDVGPSYNYAWKNTFDLTPYIGLLTGSDTLSFQTVQSGDGWVLDYAKLTVTAVPEPTSYAMVLAGLAAVGAFARRRRKG